ncbi:MAG TPA: hypothetical protein VGE64_03675 [Xanthomonadaceae bacterium]
MIKTATTGTLKHGLKIGETFHKDFEFKTDITAGDYFLAEEAIGAKGTLRFDAELVARQLVRIGTFTGPFSADLLATLKTSDMNALMRRRELLEAEGNAEPSGEPTSSPEKP